MDLERELGQIRKDLSALNDKVDNLKPGRKIRIMFLMGLLTLHLSVDSCREYDHLFTDGGGWGEDHDFPILKTLRGIAMRLGELHNDEDVCILSSLDGKHIPLS